MSGTICSVSFPQGICLSIITEHFLGAIAYMIIIGMTSPTPVSLCNGMWCTFVSPGKNMLQFRTGSEEERQQLRLQVKFRDEIQGTVEKVRKSLCH